MANFDTIWANILAHEGEEFYTITRLPFTYRVAGGAVVTSRTDYQLDRRNFEQAFAHMPLTGPGQISFVRGPSYVYAILTDRRICGAEVPPSSWERAWDRVRRGLRLGRKKD